MNPIEDIFDPIKPHLELIFANEPSGHDFWHIQRVFNLSMLLCNQEKANPVICGIAACLHEFDDPKLIELTGGVSNAIRILQQLNVSDSDIDAIVDIIKTVSFKGAGVATPMKTIEGKVVQDADRLDAMGAIGIARTFTFGGNKGRLIYHPDIKPICHTSPTAYFDKTGPTINHFYEKLLLLKDRMNTSSGKRIAEERHAFMEAYLKEFYKEWYIRQ
jgi:uncharacterized protein